MSATSSTNELNPVEPVEALDDEGNPFVHTDITEIPALLASEDILTQSEAMQGIMLPGSRLSPNSHTEFDNFPVKDLTLHRLRNDYSTQNARMAMTRLRGRSRLVIQADDKIDPVFPMYGWRNNIHRIDSFTVIPKYFGLTAIIPNVALDHNYSFDFTLSQRHKIWQGKYIDLGFNPKGRMLHIGRAQGQNVWLAMVPAEFWGQVSRSQDYDEDQNESSTIVPTDRYRKICFLMSFLLTRSGIGGVFAEHTYSRNLDAPETNGWHVDTNIFHQPVYSLRLDDVRKLHEMMTLLYEVWLRNAPQGWFKDTFFTDSKPMAITSLFGQDQPIAVAGHEELECENWEAERDYTQIRSISIALATHVSVRPILNLTPMSDDEVVERNSGRDYAYTHWHPSKREEVDIADTPLYDGDDLVPLYDNRGFPISRVKKQYYLKEDPPSILADLRQIADLYHLYDAADDDEEQYIQRANVNIYPQALSGLGNIQASRPIPVVQARIHQVNKSTRHTSAHVPITCHNFQGYNYQSHITRTSARTHIAQTGPLTQLFAGTSLENPGSNRKFAKAQVNAVRGSLAHKRLQAIIDNSSADIAGQFRLEVNYTIHMNQLQEHLKHGSTLFKHVIVPLTKQWDHPSVTESLRPCLTVLKPGLFPQMYNWVAFGITSAMEHIFQINRILIVDPPHSQPISPFYVEIISALERVYNFVHTGNSKVLIRSVMDALWFSQGIKIDGFPAFHPELRALLNIDTDLPHHETPLLGLQRIWPAKPDGSPAEASKCGQMHTYGKVHWDRYMDHFRLVYAIQHVPPANARKDFFPRIIPRPDERQSRALTMAQVIVQSFIRDVTSAASPLIEKLIRKDALLPVSETHIDPQKSKQFRLRQLTAWTLATHPLSLNTVPAKHLAYSLLHAPTPDLFKVPKSAVDVSLSDLAEAFYKTANRARKYVLPFAKGFSSVALLPVCLNWLAEEQDTPTSTEVLRDQFCNLIIAALTQEMVQRIPGISDRNKNDYGHWTPVPHNTRDRQAVHASLTTRSKTPMADDDDIAKQLAWSTLDVQLNDIPKYITRTTTPTNFATAMPLENTSGYFLDTYQWAYNFFDIDNPVCHYAMWIAFVASRTCQMLRHDNKPPPELVSLANQGQPVDEASITRFVRDAKWLGVGAGGSTNSKGRNNAATQFTMTLVYFLAMLHRESPLRRRMDNNEQSLGTDWTAKHGQKAINGFNMIRFGLAVGRNKKVFRSASYGQDWEVISLESVTVLHARMATLLPQPYGLFSWLCEVVGPRRAADLPIDMPPNAKEIAQTLRQQMWAEPSPRPETPARSPSPPKHITLKRKAPSIPGPIEISDEYDTDERHAPRKHNTPSTSKKRRAAISRFPPSQSVSSPGSSDMGFEPKKPRKFRGM